MGFLKFEFRFESRRVDIDVEHSVAHVSAHSMPVYARTYNLRPHVRRTVLEYFRAPGLTVEHHVDNLSDGLRFGALHACVSFVAV